MFSGVRVLDCTLGGGGHSEAILSRLGGAGQVVGLDCDEMALAAATRRLQGFTNFRAVRANFGQLEDEEFRQSLGLQDRILMDLGVSSPQFDLGERGFSIRHNGPLDMRMDQRLERTAREIVETASEEELRRIFFQFGEEPQAGKVARHLVRARTQRSLVTTSDLVEVLAQVLGGPRRGKVHPATRIFQALRMEVNQELERLQAGLRGAYELLAPEGRLLVLSYHSLEDRCVKQFFQSHAGRCQCPRGVPVCVCGAQASLKFRGRAIQASAEEVRENPRARSVRLRVAIRV